MNKSIDSSTFAAVKKTQQDTGDGKKQSAKYNYFNF